MICNEKKQVSSLFLSPLFEPLAMSPCGFAIRLSAGHAKTMIVVTEPERACELLVFHRLFFYPCSARSSFGQAVSGILGARKASVGLVEPIKVVM